MSISIKEYFALAGSQYTNADARIIGPVLHELSTEKEPSVADVVEIARSTNCPLHKYFEWDDQTAANTYREGQAREMLRTIRVRYSADRRDHVERAYKVKQTVPRPPANVVPVRVSVQDDVGVIAAEAIRDLDAWRIKYASSITLFGKYAEVLQFVTNQIGEFRADFEDGNLSGPFRKMVAEFFEWHQTHVARLPPVKLYGEHMIYMLEAVADARAAFEKYQGAPRHEDAEDDEAA